MSSSHRYNTNKNSTKKNYDYVKKHKASSARNFIIIMPSALLLLFMMMVFMIDISPCNAWIFPNPNNQMFIRTTTTTVDSSCHHFNRNTLLLLQQQQQQYKQRTLSPPAITATTIMSSIDDNTNDNNGPTMNRRRAIQQKLKSVFATTSTTATLAVLLSTTTTQRPLPCWAIPTIDVNNAMAREFTAFPGLYPTIATKIVMAAKEQPFQSKKDVYAILNEIEQERLKQYDSSIIINQPDRALQQFKTSQICKYECGSRTSSSFRDEQIKKVQLERSLDY